MKTMICPNCWGSKKDLARGTPCSYCNSSGVKDDLQLSDHFWLSEFLYSETAVRSSIPNVLPDGWEQRLAAVAADLLEPIRAEFGGIHVNSGFRCAELNAALPGHSKTSVHMSAFASDIRAMSESVSRKQIIDFVIAKDLPYDQVIFEGTWVHVGRYAPDLTTVRKEKLMMFPKPGGGPGYSAYDPNDPRVGAL